MFRKVGGGGGGGAVGCGSDVGLGGWQTRWFFL